MFNFSCSFYFLFAQTSKLRSKPKSTSVWPVWINLTQMSLMFWVYFLASEFISESKLVRPDGRPISNGPWSSICWSYQLISCDSDLRIDATRQTWNSIRGRIGTNYLNSDRFPGEKLIVLVIPKNQCVSVIWPIWYIWYLLVIIWSLDRWQRLFGEWHRTMTPNRRGRELLIFSDELNLTPIE